MPKPNYAMTYDDAKELMRATVASANKHKVPGAIAIVDHGGSLMLLERLDDTMIAAADITIGKAATAVAFRRPTIDIEKVILEGRSPMLELDGATSFAYVPLKGGYPIWYENEVVGGVAVGGTMDADMDEVVVLEGMKDTAWLSKKS